MRWILPAVLLLSSCGSPSHDARKLGASPSAATGVLGNAEVIPLRFASAVELAKTLNEVIDVPMRAGCVLYPPNKTWPRREPEIRVLADARTNSLIVQGSPDELAHVRDLVARLDIEVR